MKQSEVEVGLQIVAEMLAEISKEKAEIKKRRVQLIERERQLRKDKDSYCRALRIDFGMEVKEIGALMGDSENTAYAYMSRQDWFQKGQRPTKEVNP